MKVAAHHNLVAPQNDRKYEFAAWLYELCQAYHHSSFLIPNSSLLLLYFYSFCFIIMTVNYITLSGRRSLQQRSFVVGFFGWDRLHRLRRFLKWLRFLVRYGYVSDSTPMFLYRTYGEIYRLRSPLFYSPPAGETRR